MAQVGRYVGVGIDTYESHPTLEHAVAEVRAMAERLRPEFAGEPLLDADETQVSAYLKDVVGSAPGGSLVLLWCGHAAYDGGKLVLQTRDDRGEVDAASAVRRCVRSGAAQLLFVLDTCYAAGGLPDIGAVTAALLRERPPNADHVWFGVLVSCAETDRGAVDGRFGTALEALYRDGPRSPDMRRRWSRHERLIRGDDLAQALLEVWPADEEQRPDFQSRGMPVRMLPNPWWDEGAPEVVVEHLLLAARGGAAADERSWFTGRADEVDEVVSWVRSGTPGVRVVTGSAGTGKTAIVGRVVSLANPDERARLLDDDSDHSDDDRALPHTDPGLRSVAAHVHARGLTADRVAEVLDGGLIRAGVLPADEHGRRNAAELVGALQRAGAATATALPPGAEYGHAEMRVLDDAAGDAPAAGTPGPGAGAPPVVLVVDGLDEARGEAFAIAETLLVPLARYATVVVSTRPVRQDEPPRSVVDELAPVAMIDLDEPARRDSGRAALRDYVVARLRGVAASMDPERVAERLVATSAAPGAATDDRPFLLARVVTDQLRAAPVDTGLPEWERYLADSIETAFDVDLARVTPPEIGLAPEVSAPELARTLLMTLTWAFGAGFPEEEWLTVASRLAGAGLGREHVTWVLDQLGRYVVQDGEGGMAVYRVAHQSLADHLRPAYRRTGEQPFDPEAMPVWEALATRYAALLGAGIAAEAPSYLWRYAHRHAAQAGLPGLDQLRELVAADAALRPNLADAALEVADVSRSWGRRTDALPPTEEALALYRTLVDDNPAYLPELARALTNLGVRYSELGRHTEALPPTEDAVQIRRALAADNPAFLPDLADALNNLGIRSSELGRLTDVLPPIEESVAIYRSLAAVNLAFLPDLALALNNLGVCYSELGRHTDALAPTEDAVQLYRDLATDDRAVLSDVALALYNLGIRYSDLGRHTDALPPTEESVQIRRALTADNPAYLPDLANGLTSLAIRNSELGRHTDALVHFEEAAEIRRALAATDNPAFLPDLAGALNNLGSSYSRLGRHTDALPPTEDAVQLYRDLAADNPADLPSLALALNNLGNRYSDLGRHTDALHATEESVQIRRELAADNPAYLPDLASSLNNVGNRYSNLGRYTDALPPTEDAVQLYRDLAADNPAYLPDLASTLNNLGIRYSKLDRPTDALPPTEDAVRIRRDLAADNPAYLPDLAGALNNLGISYSNLGRHTDALPPTEESVQIRRALTADNPAYLPDLAGALNSLGGCYSKLDRPTDALAPTEDAVQLFRDQVADNPAFLPDLAGALNNLGIAYSALGRTADALPPTEESVQLFRDLAADNPAFLPDLAGALTNLGTRHAEGGEPDKVDPVWQDVLEERGTEAGALLLYYRAAAADLDDLRTAAWLVPSCIGPDRGLASAARTEARRRRADDPPAWDAAWTAATNEPSPAWLTVDPDLLATATTWIATPTYDDERDHLAAHPELLDSAAATAVEEALLRIDERAGDRYRRLLADAREHGVDAAYRPLLLRVLAGQFRQAAAAEQRTLLADRRDDLLDDVVCEHLAESRETDETNAVDRALALLDLARTDDPALSDTFDALDDPARFPDLLAAIAHRAELAALRPLATIAFSAAKSEAEAATASVYLAVATDDPQDAADAIRQARTWHPDGVPTWITLLADLGRTHPAVLSLIPVLLEEPDDGEH